MSENKIAKAKERARRMKELAFGENGLFKILSESESQLMETLVNTDIEAHDLREDIYHRVNAIRGVKETMQAAINKGVSADTLAKRLSTMPARVKIQ